MPEYKCIVADPPWLERGGGKVKRGADRHYRLMKAEDIVRVMLTSPKWTPDRTGCHLWLWVTANHLEEGLFVMRALGFRYVTNMCWYKGEVVTLVQQGKKYLKLVDDKKFGLGQYLRGLHEICLFGVMGRQSAAEKNVPSAFIAPRGAHSKKPDVFLTNIVPRVSGTPSGLTRPCLEMFSRGQAILGWDTWGDEAK